MGDVTTLSSLAQAIRASEQDSAESYLILKAMHPGYLGSATIVTRPNYSAAVPSRSTLSSIAATADSFIVKAWNGNGCWTWRVPIASEEGALLPAQSTVIGLSRQAGRQLTRGEVRAYYGVCWGIGSRSR